MRKLITKDAFKLMQLLRTAGMKAEFAEILDMRGKDVVKVGERVFGAVFDLLGHPATEGALCALLGDVAGKTADEVKNQTIPDTVRLIRDILAENDVGAFFGQAPPTT